MKKQLEMKKKQSLAGKGRTIVYPSTKKWKSQQTKNQAYPQKNGCLMNGENRTDVLPGITDIV